MLANWVESHHPRNFGENVKLWKFVTCAERTRQHELCSCTSEVPRSFLRTEADKECNLRTL
jgi:hypothetical protein